MNPYLEVIAEFYSRAVEHLERNVIPHCTDAKTVHGLKLLAQHGREMAAKTENAKKIADGMSGPEKCG